MPGHVQVDVDAMLAAAAELDAAAARLTAMTAATSAALHPLPAGSDEVSLLASRHFVAAARSMDAAVTASVAELHETAAALRVQAAGYRQVDTTFSASLSGGVS